MLQRLSTYLLFLSLLFFTSCIDVEEYTNDAVGNTEALWQIMDQHYCFFQEKQQTLGVEWNDVHKRYAANASNSMSRSQLFEFLSKMIGELKDGHVNLSASFDFARNWSWKEDYPLNFSEELQRQYLSDDYKIAAGMYYRILDDNIGYIYLGSFSSTIGDGNLDEILLYLAPCTGLIIDVRHNGGGMLTEAQKVAARFCNERTFVGTMKHKTGSGHNDFSEPEQQWIEPSTGIRWQKKVCVLTNRSVFSAANEFVKYMKQMPLATIIGDKTGGGAGMPYSAELPNGWAVRFSACPMYDVDGNSTEDGIDPDITASVTSTDKDDIIEAARQYLK